MEKGDDELAGNESGSALEMSLFDRVAAGIVSLLVPDSLLLEGGEKWGAQARGNGGDAKRSHEKSTRFPGIQVGDIILTRTPGAIMQVARGVANSPFDHAVVVVGEGTVVHVSPPQVRLLRLSVILQEKRSPLLLRPALSKEERDVFISTVTSFVGEKYNASRAVALLSRLILEQQLGVKPRSPLNRKGDSLIGNGPICTDIVFIGLCKASPFFRNIILDSELTKQMDYVTHGGASFMDLVRLNKHVPRSLRYYPLADLTGDHMNAGGTDSRSKIVSETRNKNIATAQQDLVQGVVNLQETPALRAMDKNLEGAKTLPDKIEKIPGSFEKVALSLLNRFHTQLPDKRLTELSSIEVVEERLCSKSRVYGHRLFTYDAKNAVPSILKSMISGDDTNVVFEEKCIFDFRNKCLTVVTCNQTLTSYCDMYSRITVEEVANVSNDKVELGNHCTIRESGQLSVHGVPYLLQGVAKRFLVDAASVNYNRMIGMVQERLHSYDYKLNLHAKRIFFINESGTFSEDTSGNDKDSIGINVAISPEYRSRL